ncbi:MAG: hypothetical protein AABY10_00025 [Nanoarchaeota archaeon]
MTDTDHIKELRERVEKGVGLDDLFDGISNPDEDVATNAADKLALRIGKIRGIDDDTEAVLHGRNYLTQVLPDPYARKRLREGMVRPERVYSVDYTLSNFISILGEVGRERLAADLAYKVAPHDGGDDVHQGRVEAHKKFLKAQKELAEVQRDPSEKIAQERVELNRSIDRTYADYDADSLNVLRSVLNDLTGPEIVIEQAARKAGKAKKGFDNKFSNLDERADYTVGNARYILENDHSDGRNSAYEVAKLLVS